jgi:hypothetical protein
MDGVIWLVSCFPCSLVWIVGMPLVAQSACYPALHDLIEAVQELENGAVAMLREHIEDSALEFVVESLRGHDALVHLDGH